MNPKRLVLANVAAFAAIFLTTGSTMALGANTNQVPALDGTWICLSATIDGKPLPDETVRLLRLTLTRIRYKTQKGSEILFDSTYTVDPTKRPKQINMMGTEGALKGKEALGIYLADGNTFQICYTMPGKERPESFESAPGSGAYLIVWQRRRP